MTLRVERDGAVAVLVLDRPASLNAFDDALTAALAAGRTHDYAEGVRAFIEKRPARFEGR